MKFPRGTGVAYSIASLSRIMTTLRIPPSLAHLPPPSDAARETSAALVSRIDEALETAGGWLPFERYMELALYAPGMGYYSAGAVKLGAAGDFVTAPELTPLFGATLARQMAPLLAACGTDILELGGGTGALAVSVMQGLERIGALPARYRLLDVSADLRSRQRERIDAAIPHLADRFEWLDALPTHMNGIVLGNEVLDALPVRLVHATPTGIMETGVVRTAEGYAYEDRPADAPLASATELLELPDDYRTEICTSLPAFIGSLASMLGKGAMLFIDYGFPRSEYYHQQRNRGTLMCHYRHHAHDDPFALVGLQDITAHVDFTAVAEAAVTHGLDVLGYISQARFLLNAGLMEEVAATPADDVVRYAPLASQTQRLVSPAEMGELFKVIALGRSVDVPLAGFTSGDRTHTL